MSTVMNVRFMYLRNNDGRPVACVASKFDKDVGIIRYGMSICHTDDQFNKAMARKIALGRLNSEAVMKFYVNSDVKGRDISVAILNDIYEHRSSMQLSRIIRKSIKNKLAYYSAQNSY